MGTRDFLFELFTEELPPASLQELSSALAAHIVGALAVSGITHGRVRTFATPRRLAVSIESCLEAAPDRPIERRGPPLASAFDAGGAPTQAALAFARSCGTEVALLGTQTTDKGAWLVFRGTEPGAVTAQLLGPLVVQAVAALPLAKRMRWGARSAEFVRPVHAAVVLFGADVVPCEVLGIAAGRVTYGHRFHAPRPIELTAPKRYEAALGRARVIADFDERRERVRAGVNALAVELGGRALMRPELLDEVTALVEWPVPIAGRFEERFLRLPREVVISTVQDHQRYFPVEDDSGRLTNWFITVSNIESRDPLKVREGNERVVRPRLSDAAFFWDQDRKQSLEAHAARLAGVVFQTRLGSYADKSRRVQVLAEWIGARIDAGVLVARAAALAKADLVTAMVGEFPELQGTMGRHYAALQGEPPELAAAIEEQYQPRFSGDALPATKLGQALALADKIDTLAGIFAIDQKPTGAKDPFGLRRAALGVLRILLEREIDLDLDEALNIAAAAQPVQRPGTVQDVQAFITERLRGLLAERANGVTAEMLDAVFAVRPRSPLDAERRLLALGEFLMLPDAPVLAAANKRIANILRKARIDAGVGVDPTCLRVAAETLLHAAVEALRPAAAAAMRIGAYGEYLRLAASLCPAIDAFFESVMVMDPDTALRNNRLALLGEVQALIGRVADLSRLPG